MERTEEQLERIRKNRERAAELRKRKLEREQAEREGKVLKRSSEDHAASGGKCEEVKKGGDQGKIELEEFEVGASEFVTKAEAMKMYCLPEGTLAVCKVTEKENPKNKKWKSMKLYVRSEIRSRARKRYGGLEGLIRERQQRAEKRFKKDLEKTKDLFR